MVFHKIFRKKVIDLKVQNTIQLNRLLKIKRFQFCAQNRKLICYNVFICGIFLILEKRGEIPVL